MYTDNYFNRFELAPEVAEALKKCKCIAYAETKEEQIGRASCRERV